MKFVFYDKSNNEADIIASILWQENMPFYVKRKIIRNVYFSEDDEDEDENIVIVEELYDIVINTDLEHYDYIKSLAEKKIQDRIQLERCYLLEPDEREKHVQRVHKKNPTNTNRKRRGKSKE